MKKFASLLYGLICCVVCLHAQTVQLVNCINEGGVDIPRMKETIDGIHYLLTYKNATTNNYYIQKLNADGNSAWKLMIPNTDKCRYKMLIPNFNMTYLELDISDIPHKLYTRNNKETYIHFAYYDSTYVEDNKTKFANNILQFGVVNTDLGTYTTPLFTVDTLMSFKEDTLNNISEILVNKLTDSTYQMAVSYNTLKGAGFYTYFARNYFNFYTIHAPSKTILHKTSIEGNGNLMEHNNRFYIIKYDWIIYSGIQQNLYSINQQNGIDTIIRIGDETYGFTMYVEQNNAQKISLILNKNSSYLNYSIYREIDLQTYQQADYLVNTNITDTAFDSYSEYLIYNDFANQIKKHSPLINNDISKMINLDYKVNTSAKKNFIHTYSKSDFNNPSLNIRKNYLSKINTNAYQIEFEKDISNYSIGYEDFYLDYRDDILPNQYILLLDDTVVIDTIDAATYNYKYTNHLSIEKLDSNYNSNWKIDLPDSIIASDSLVYMFSNPNLPVANSVELHPIQYKNQFIITATYCNNTNPLQIIPIQKNFLVDIETGALKDMQLPLFIEQSSLKPQFFCSTDNKLSIIVLTACADSADIGIYQYQDLVNSLSNKQTTQLQFTVFPNPANTHISVDLSQWNYQKIQYTLFDITGKQLRNGYIENQNRLHLDVAALTTGMYFLHLNDGEHSGSEKFQIMR